MNAPIVECVPNFSEGRDKNIIHQITNEIKQVDGAKLLDVDPGHATNRTVVTIVGEPEAVVEAAFRAIVKAGELIDMRKHSGEHPRMGATDVCPFIPVANMSMEDAAACAHRLGERLGKETDIPIYIYGDAQKDKKRNNLSVIRSGEYEGLFDKISKPNWKPDYGKAEMNAKKGATCVGARDFLIAYNVNLNTKSTRIANRIAFDVREAGRVKRKGNPYTGEIVRDETGKTVREPGKCKSVKAIGWFIEEYKVAQISANLTDYKVTAVHTFFDEVCKSADSRGVRVTGSELVGLIPLKAIKDAGIHYLQKQGRSTGVSEEEVIHIAVKSLGLDELSAFDPNEKIIEYRLRDLADERLVQLSAKQLVYETGSESMAPGGGSIAAYAGAMGAALGTMVANLGANKRGWENRVEEFSGWAVEGQKHMKQLLFLVDEDTRSFNRIIDAIRMSKGTDEEKEARKIAIETASQYATEVPAMVMDEAASALTLIRAMVEKGNPSSITDGGVGAICLQTAVMGAFMNVKVNAKDLGDRQFADAIVTRCEELEKNVKKEVAEIISMVNEKLGV